MIYLKIEEGVAIDTIVASQEYIDSLEGDYILSEEGYGIGDTYDGISLSKKVDVISEEETLAISDSAKTWRNEELSSTDARSCVSDDPNHDNLIIYRQQLRDWTSTSDFPDIRPTLNN